MEEKVNIDMCPVLSSFLNETFQEKPDVQRLRELLEEKTKTIGVDLQKSGLETNQGNTTFVNNLAKSSYAITTHPQSSKTELTIWENGTAATIGIDRDQLLRLVEELSHCVR